MDGCFLGMFAVGAVAVPMDDGATEEFAARVARETSARVVVAASGKPSLGDAIRTLKLEDLADRTRRPRAVVTQRSDGEPRLPIHESLLTSR